LASAEGRVTHRKTGLQKEEGEMGGWEEGRKGRREEGRKGGRKEGRKEGRKGNVERE